MRSRHRLPQIRMLPTGRSNGCPSQVGMNGPAATRCESMILGRRAANGLVGHDQRGKGGWRRCGFDDGPGRSPHNLHASRFVSPPAPSFVIQRFSQLSLLSHRPSFAFVVTSPALLFSPSTSGLFLSLLSPSSLTSFSFSHFLPVSHSSSPIPPSFSQFLTNSFQPRTITADCRFRAPLSCSPPSIPSTTAVQHV